LLKTGPTHTNVMDVRVALVTAPHDKQLASGDSVAVPHQ
jgi:hypothetical protein